jgi:hypothetical protein
VTEEEYDLIRAERTSRYLSFPRRFRGLSLEGVTEEDLLDDDLMYDYYRYLSYLMR